VLTSVLALSILIFFFFHQHLCNITLVKMVRKYEHDRDLFLSCIQGTGLPLEQFDSMYNEQVRAVAAEYGVGPGSHVTEAQANWLEWMVDKTMYERLCTYWLVLSGDARLTLSSPGIQISESSSRHAYAQSHAGFRWRSTNCSRSRTKTQRLVRYGSY
jgi:hypothetical protein